MRFWVSKETHLKGGASCGGQAHVINDFCALPESFGGLSSLESFHIDGGNITTLPDSFGNLGALKTLYIENSHLESLPDSFGNLRSLEELNIDNGYYRYDENEKQAVPLALPAAIGKLSKLTKLTINAPLQPIPDWLGGLSSLNELRITSDTITSLPDSLCALPSLKEIFIDCAKLAALPENIGSLKNLTGLYVESEALTTLPDSTGSLNALEQLRIEGSSFSVLPQSVGNLSSLTRLYLYRTKIKTLPNSIGNLSNLKKIRLLRCIELESLPESIGNLRFLETLYIRCGKITALPESIGNVSSLIGIQLQYTAITSLPESIGNLTNLASLGIYSSPNDMPWDYHFDSPPDYREDDAIEKKSPFAVLPDTVSKLASLRLLKLSNTEITSLPGYLADLPKLEKIEIVGCNVKTIPPEIQRLVDSGELTLFKTEREFNEFQWSHSERKKPRRSK
jgi:Leucine-rich repeat (LRR) protein